MKTLGLMLIALMLVSNLTAQDYGGGDEFGPFRDDEKIEKVSLKPMDIISTAQTSPHEQDQKLGFLADPQATAFQVTTSPSQAVFQMIRGKKKPVLQFSVDNVGYFSIYSADLNGDNLPDYVIEVYKNEDETSAQEEEDPRGQSVLLLLSNHKSYKAYQIPGANFLSWGFVKLKSGADTQFLCHAQIRKNPFKETPERACLFHLYQLLNIHGAAAELDTTTDPRFPKFVCQDLGTLRKNHKETKLLTADEKKKILAEHPVQIVQIPVKALSKKHRQ